MAEENRKWPYHIAIPAELCQGINWLVIMDVCKGFKICDVHYSVKRNAVDYAVYLFSDYGQAEKFRSWFNGEFIDLKESSALS